jgi:hypothetical protein
VIVRPFEPFHIDVLKAQGPQLAQISELSIVPQGTVIRPHGSAVTAFDGDTILLCGGVIPQFKNGICWALLSSDAAKHMSALHYATKRFLTIQNWQRLEATVEEGFASGCRWVELLGFKFEGRMPKYGPLGETHLRYGRT